MNERKDRLAIIGAGPIGLEAALQAVEMGFDVQVYERGNVAAHVRDWGHVRLFSPFGMNASERGRRLLRTSHDLPDAAALLTGREFAERYLLPLSRLPQLAGRVHERTEVVSIGRGHLMKGDLIGKTERGNDAFRLLIRNKDGERFAAAEVVLDCSGVFGNHNWAGAGGVPCVGERETLTATDYGLREILGRDRAQYAGKRTLVLGSGYSAATAVVALAQLAADVPGTSALWVTRRDRTPPMPRIENDALPERDRLSADANRLAMSTDSPIDWRFGRQVAKLNRNADGRIDAMLDSTGPGKGVLERVTVDTVIANVGYRPDRSLYEELQVHECYATQGPIKLAAALLGETSPDCLSQTGHGVQTLRNPEPGFFILGAKSYGRDSRFLITIGLQQIQDVLQFLIRQRSFDLNT
ncbi:MAG: monooxygenase [Planctomycetaceae bacterium]